MEMDMKQIERKGKRLTDLKPGESAIMKALDSKSKIRRRLFDLGFLCGTSIKCLTKSPLGDPIAYIVRGTVIALRKEDAFCVLIEENDKGQSFDIDKKLYRNEGKYEPK